MLSKLHMKNERERGYCVPDLHTKQYEKNGTANAPKIQKS